MKTIGLLGGTGWSSTIVYYKRMNELVASRMGGYNSAKILLRSVNYQEIMSHYGKDDMLIADILKRELQALIDMSPDCIVICCNSLHKFYDMVKHELRSSIPVMHAVELVAENMLQTDRKTALLLATKFTMEDGFFAKILEAKGMNILVPNDEEREQMKVIHDELMQNAVTQNSKDYFASLILKYNMADSVILGCTEYPLIVTKDNSCLPIIDPVELQVIAAVDFALE